MPPSTQRAQIIYFSHGGGPLPLLGDPGHKTLVDFWRQLPSRLARPEAILVISAHWEEDVATLTGAAAPDLVYDYYGFPAQAYEITWPAPGHPELARRIAGLLQRHNAAVRIDPERGFDHGVFVPLKLMYPKADIPSLQLSLLGSLDPAAHIALGAALGDLLSENILIIGSGASFHNFNALRRQVPDARDAANDAFQDWLVETCAGSLRPPDREQRLIEWEKAPSARYCHPREDHLLPLHVCVGLLDTPAQVVFDDRIMGIRNLAFLR